MNIQLLVTTVGFSLSFIILVTLGIFVLLRGSRQTMQTTFAFLNFSVAAWALVFIFGTNIKDPDLALLVWRFNIVDVVLIASFCHWIFAITKKTKEMKRAIQSIYTFGLGIIIASIIFPAHFVSSVNPKMYFNNYANPGIIYYIMFLYFMLLGAYMLFFLMKVQKETKDHKEKNKLRYVVLGSLIGWFVGPMAFPLVWDIQFDPVLSMFIGFYNLVFAYAIFKHNLMDIKVVLRRAFFYSVGIALVSGLLIIISLLNNWFIENIAGFRIWMIPFVASIVSVVVGTVFWRAMQETDRLKYQFVSIASHKLRTPLTYIRWEIANILEDPKNDISVKTEASLERISSAGEELVEISDVLLEVSKQDGQIPRYKLEKMDITESVKNIFEKFNNIARGKGISLSFHVEDSSFEVYGNAVKLEQVMSTLVDNAIVYTPEGGAVKILLKKQRNSIKFIVEDTGIGLTKEERDHVFIKFFRSKEALLTDTTGIGLDLFLAKEIIKQHNGKIGVESRGLDMGSSFWFKLKESK